MIYQNAGRGWFVESVRNSLHDTLQIQRFGKSRVELYPIITERGDEAVRKRDDGKFDSLRVVWEVFQDAE
jgi:hypothetical protein